MKKFFNKQIKILLLTNGVIILAGAMLGPIYALFVQEIGGDLLGAAYAFGIYAFVAGIVTIVSGRYTDTIKENELIIVLGYGIMAFAFFSYTLVSSIYSLLFVQALVGMGEAIYAPAFDALYSRYLEKKKSGRTWGTWEGMHYFATATGAIAGGFLVTCFGFNVMFVAMGLLCLFSAIYILILPRVVL